MSLKLTRDGDGDKKLSLPVQFEIEGARSEVIVEMEGSTYELKDHRIPIERTRLGVGARCRSRPMPTRATTSSTSSSTCRSRAGR